jgi:hypothetical protein
MTNFLVGAMRSRECRKPKTKVVTKKKANA